MATLISPSGPTSYLLFAHNIHTFFADSVHILILQQQLPSTVAQTSSEEKSTATQNTAARTSHARPSEAYAHHLANCPTMRPTQPALLRVTPFKVPSSSASVSASLRLPQSPRPASPAEQIRRRVSPVETLASTSATSPAPAAPATIPVTAPVTAQAGVAVPPNLRFEKVIPPKSLYWQTQRSEREVLKQRVFREL
ncbi:hypothetical protein K437DRAFT_151116 [Tilletiaria anomala UBC 951]|uniref:Uncharacterized protein n=1 Tax=Tilletiaria anomala (strain ATCC 24038 / CBS 436.72 / UBC 951) TaxID=1037660 RepID=A0A066VYC0_TILAU|nr:uncharacterized protein K437DRAFT_151116 [Tilletiaria anomala UBC 951]KDN43535.1 hypothetical protein K437DRAFT_151116 [Tilletiaria anomala UBC 951]